jgi:hypothetical protein
MDRNGLTAASSLELALGFMVAITFADTSTIAFTPNMAITGQCRNEVREQSLPGAWIESITSEEMNIAMDVGM